MKLIFAMEACSPLLLASQRPAASWVAARCGQQGIAFDCYFYGESSSQQPDWVPAGCGRAVWDQAWSLSPQTAASHLAQMADQGGYDGVLVFQGGLSNEIAVLTAQLLDCRSVTGVTRMELGAWPLRVWRNAYNNNMEASFSIPQGRFVLGCGDLPRGEETACPVTEGLEQWPEQPVPSHILNQTLVQPRVENPASQVLLVAGKGIRSRDDVDVIRTFAHERGYQFGVTRPVAMSGWGRLHEIIGVSGSICAPKVCITLGVSGSAAFYAGITHSDFIASVNSSPEAPIHKLSDVSIVDDYANVWQRLFALLKERDAQCAR